MIGKFDNVRTDEGAIIIFRTVAILGEYEVLYEKWSWDGITAESIIFANEDISELSDKELEFKVKESPLVKGSSITVKKSESGYTFVNFNFEY
jgi:hypothetical protein